MVRYISLLIFVMAFAASGVTWASPPVITNNVTVAQNATPDQCSSSWEGRTSPEIVETFSGFGTNDEITSPVIRSCTGCAIVASSKDCVCQTCYDHFN